MNRWSAIVAAVAVIALSVLGVAMLASTSYYSDEVGGATYFTLRQHLIWLGLAVVTGGAALLVDYHWFYRLRWWIFAGTAVTLALCYAPFLGEQVNGAARWVTLKRLGLGFVHLQPSEFAKIGSIIVLAGWFARQEPLTREFMAGLHLIPVRCWE